MKVYSIRDMASESYSLPAYFPARGAALRSFMDMVGNEETVYGQHPEHFVLFELGSFDQATGVLEILTAPELVAKAWELVPAKVAAPTLVKNKAHGG